MFPTARQPISMTQKNHLFKHQELAADQMKTGSILCGGVGSGKSRTAVMYYYKNELGKDLYIITTAAKRDTLDWERECALFMLSRDRTASIKNVKVTVDSWNNIKKYIYIENAFFIFDEQRVIGSGAWVRSFLKIVKKNNWILLSATPGDTWMDYIPVFVANGFYKNRTEFIRRHVVYNSFTKFPKIDRYIEEGRLRKLKEHVLVNMDYVKPTTSYVSYITAKFDKEKLKIVTERRWNPYTNNPIKNISEMIFLMRKVVTSDISRLGILLELLRKHRRIIVFYNFDYELELLREFKEDSRLSVTEYNGHKHEDIPDSESWLYLVQYLSGSEGWNCITTNAVVFYSLNYSYRIMTQAAGRIDRLNTPYTKLYYYNIISNSSIDKAIEKALKEKKSFNESSFLRRHYSDHYKTMPF